MLFVLLNLILIESVLSIDNAAILAAMVKNLPAPQQPKALRYGIVGAFLCRGLCLVGASFIVNFLWLKIAGGVFLLWLAFKHFFLDEEETKPKSSTKSLIWTIVLIEWMDLSFSIDNVFAAVALSNKIWLVMTGVFIGIVAMRFVAQYFIVLMERFPSMKHSVYVVILLLGWKLVISGLADYVNVFAPAKNLFEYEYFDMWFSIITILIFAIPILFDHMKLRDTKIPNDR